MLRWSLSLVCACLGLQPNPVPAASPFQVSTTEPALAKSFRSIHSIFLEGALFESGKITLDSARFLFSPVPGADSENKEPRTPYELEYIYPNGKTIKAACFVDSPLAWKPRGAGDLAHSWHAEVLSNQQGIGFRILKNGQVVSKHMFSRSGKPVEFDISHTVENTYTWRIHRGNGEIAISWDQGQTWQSTPTMRCPAGTIQLPTSQLQLNPQPWIFLQGFKKGVIFTKLYIVDLLLQ